MRKILEKCPSCGGDLAVTRMACPSCGTVVKGAWAPCHFCQLSPEHTRLLESFVRSRGNVKEMARELDISYWTVRKQVDELIEALGYEPAPPAPEDTAQRQMEILEQLSSGEISADEATALLGELKMA
ncbi:MAG: DUF2089 domain-containing protein [Anaerolineae bacterium]|jgi:hypothetical protein|nr:DUF2089 domain-containing protein [Anaerolineae bacterium]